VEIIREVGPFAIGFVLLYPLVQVFRKDRSERLVRFVVFCASLAVGLFWSQVVGEQGAPALFDRLVPVLIDTCLSFTGFSVVQWLFEARPTNLRS
jgi:uncharacterized membrane protein SirB2